MDIIREDTCPILEADDVREKGKTFHPSIQVQIVLESLKGCKTMGQLARSYGVHPITIHHWKKEFIEREERISIVADFKDEYGLNWTLEIVDMPKSTWYDAQMKKDDDTRYGYLREPLIEIAEAHPEYGHRRTTAELHERGYHVNHKVVERLHRH